MREPALQRDPEVHDVTLPILVGIASAVETESAQRYARLAEWMDCRGETATADAFRLMLEEERAHLSGVERWAGALGERLPGAGQFEWRLPPELAQAWDEVAGSARLTPYRAFAIAVDNEQRAFALYSYLAARAVDPKTAAYAEQLALEELRHACVMRRWRRQAWHREQRQARMAEVVVSTNAELAALLARREAEIARRHAALAEQLRSLGDEDSARLLEELNARTPTRRAASGTADRSPVRTESVPLLVAAQESLEGLSETLEAILRSSEGELFAAAEAAQTALVRRIAQLGLQIERGTS